MKGLILSGGRGSRLRPITYTQAKQLVPVANKPVLFYGIEALVEAGIKTIGIVVGDTKEEIKAAVGDGSKWDIQVFYIEQEAPLGLAHAVMISEEFLQDEPFVMYLGDNLIKQGIKDFVAEFQKNTCHSQILLAKVTNPQQFGVAELVSDRVVRLVEKPKEPVSDLALVGVYMFDHHIFEAVKNIHPSWRGELEITDAIQYLIDRGYEIRSQIINGWWKDTGKIEDLLEANRIILDSLEKKLGGTIDSSSQVEFKVVLEPGSEIINSIVRGPAIVGSRSKIVNSFIGPFTSVGPDCLIQQSEIEHSIVMESSRIINIRRRIADSLIGKNVEVVNTATKPETYRFTLGEFSKVSIP
jgi:glucose-1-phosphate thymidylyltransferase